MDLTLLKKHSAIIGCDEVGRGPIAGPVNACAVKVCNDETLRYFKKINVTDSKKLTHKKRVAILAELEIDVTKLKLNTVYNYHHNKINFDFCVTEASHLVIDKINILQASLQSMQKASKHLQEKKAIVLIDGNKNFICSCKSQAVIKGDSKSLCIGMASIIAKVFRDEKMSVLDVLYPGYHLAKNAGYPTKEHRDAVKELGATPIHRKTFRGVKEYL